MEELDDNDNDRAFAVVTALGQVAMTHPALYLVAFRDLLFEHALELARPENMPRDRTLAIFMIDDLIEHCAAGAVPFYNLVMPFLLQGALDGEAGVRARARAVP